MGHVLAIFILWVFINSEDVQQPVFDKVISVNLTKLSPQHLPPINETQRQEIAEEKRKKDRAEKKRREDKRLAEKKKIDDAQKKDAARKKKTTDDKKKKADLKKKADADAKKKADAKKRADDKKKADAKKRADDKRRADADARKKADAKKRADDKRRAKAQQQRQTALGQNVNAAISERVQKEWNNLNFSSVQFSNNDDYVKIQITISKNGKVTSAKITSRAKTQALNSNAQALFKKITSSSYRFPAFHKDYNNSTMTVEYRLTATN